MHDQGMFFIMAGPKYVHKPAVRLLALAGWVLSLNQMVVKAGLT